MKSNKTNAKPSPPFKSIETHKHQLETWKNKFQRLKSGYQYSNPPKNQDKIDLLGLNIRVMNNDVDHWDTVTDPAQNPQTKTDFSDDRVKEMDVSWRQTSLKITFDKQTSEEVKRGIWSQALLASTRLWRSAIGSIDSGSDMSPSVGNVIDDKLMKDAMVINTIANMDL